MERARLLLEVAAGSCGGPPSMCGGSKLFTAGSKDTLLYYLPRPCSPSALGSRAGDTDEAGFAGSCSTGVRAPPPLPPSPPSATGKAADAADRSPKALKAGGNLGEATTVQESPCRKKLRSLDARGSLQGEHGVFVLRPTLEIPSNFKFVSNNNHRVSEGRV